MYMLDCSCSGFIFRVLSSILFEILEFVSEYAHITFNNDFDKTKSHSFSDKDPRKRLSNFPCCYSITFAQLPISHSFSQHYGHRLWTKTGSIVSLFFTSLLPTPIRIILLCWLVMGRHRWPGLVPLKLPSLAASSHLYNLWCLNYKLKSTGEYSSDSMLPSLSLRYPHFEDACGMLMLHEQGGVFWLCWDVPLGWVRGLFGAVLFSVAFLTGIGFSNRCYFLTVYVPHKQHLNWCHAHLVKHAVTYM